VAQRGYVGVVRARARSRRNEFGWETQAARERKSGSLQVTPGCNGKERSAARVSEVVSFCFLLERLRAARI
jgi:hypothetical protein